MTPKPKPGPRRTARLMVPCRQMDLDEVPRQLRLLNDLLLRPAAGVCLTLCQTLRDWKETKTYQHFAPTWEDFIRDHLQQPQEWIEVMIQAAELLEAHQGNVPRSGSKD